MSLPTISLESIGEKILAFLPNLGYALLIYILARLISTWAARLLRRAMQRRDHDQEIIVLLELLIRWGILAFGIVLALEQLAPGRFSSLIAGLGIAGFTIGFALQDVAKNFVAGILLLIQQPFEIGDEIEVAGYIGTVLEISLRATEMRALDGRYVFIPNGDIFVSPIVNFSRAPRRRVEITAGVSTDSDLDHVARTVMQSLDGVVGILGQPAPRITFSNFGDSTIDFKLHYWIDAGEAGILKAQDEGIRAIKTAFEREQIEMPYPTHMILTPKDNGA
jgi:small conductance mechanosensitive channel